jgi:hypothetical protein
MTIFAKEIMLFNSSIPSTNYWRMSIDLQKIKAKYLNSKEFIIGTNGKMKRKVPIKTIDSGNNNSEYNLLLTL